MERIDKETLKHWLGLPDVFLLDVRSPKAWDQSAAKIEKAHRLDPRRLSQLAQDLPKNKKLVAYCENGQTECPTFAQELEKMGFPKVYILDGGWQAWLGKKLPTVPKELD